MLRACSCGDGRELRSGRNHDKEKGIPWRSETQTETAKSTQKRYKAPKTRRFRSSDNHALRSSHSIFHTRNPLAASSNPPAAFEIAPTQAGTCASSSAGTRAPPGPSFDKHDTRPALILSSSVSGSTSSSTLNFSPHVRTQSVNNCISCAGTSKAAHIGEPDFLCKEHLEAGVGGEGEGRGEPRHMS